jgi:hypothetical protein
MGLKSDKPGTTNTCCRRSLNGIGFNHAKICKAAEKCNQQQTIWQNSVLL